MKKLAEHVDTSTVVTGNGIVLEKGVRVEHGQEAVFRVTTTVVVELVDVRRRAT
jgi:hypothetical protein